MVTRRDVLRRLISTPASVGVSLLVVSSLAGCDNPKPLPRSQFGNRDDPRRQQELETGGMPPSKDVGRKKKRR